MISFDVCIGPHVDIALYQCFSGTCQVFLV